MPFVSSQAPLEGAGLAALAAIKPGQPMTLNDAWSIAYELKFQFDSRSGRDHVLRYHKHLQNTIGFFRLEQISPLVLDGLKAKMLIKGYMGRKKPLSPQTIKHIFLVVSQIFGLMGHYGLFTGPNPVKGMQFPKIDNKRQRYLTKEEVAILLPELKAHSEVVWQMAFLSLCTGMRAGEILHLRGEHVNLSEATLRVVDPKNKDNRDISLSEVAVALLRQYPLIPGKLVFPGPSGRPMKAVSKTYFRVVEKLGFNRGKRDSRDRVVFHTLRHTFASWMVQNKVPLVVLAELLGHKTLEMTRRYAHLDRAQKVAAVANVNKYMPPLCQIKQPGQQGCVRPFFGVN